MSPGKVLLWQKCIEVVDIFVEDKESFLWRSRPAPIKVKNPFLRIRKDIGPMVNFEVARQSVVAILSNKEEDGTPRRMAPSQKGKGMVLTHQARPNKSSPNPKTKGKSTFAYRDRVISRCPP